MDFGELPLWFEIPLYVWYFTPLALAGLVVYFGVFDFIKDAITQLRSPDSDTDTE